MITFYNINKREQINLPYDRVTKKIKYRIPFQGKTDYRYRYSICAIDDDGTEMVKNCSKEEWDKFDDVLVLEEVRTPSTGR